MEAKQRTASTQLSTLNSEIEHLETKMERSQKLLKDEQDRNLRMTEQYHKEKEVRCQLEARFKSGLSKERSDRIIAENENLRQNSVSIKEALTTFRNLHQAAASEAKSLRMAIGRDEDEKEQLRKAIRDIQSESDEKTLIGKLYNEILTKKWSEANMNERQERVLDELRKLRIENNDLEVKLKTKDDELFELQASYSEKLSLTEKQLSEAKMSILPTVSISRIEDLSSKIKRLSESRIELELKNKELREALHEKSIRLEHYILKETNLLELESFLKNSHRDEVSERLIEMSKQITELKLAELKAEREVILVKQREEYHIRVNRTQVDLLKKLEEEVAKGEERYNERENFWRKRYNEQLKVVMRGKNFSEEEVQDFEFNTNEKLEGKPNRKIIRNKLKTDLARQELKSGNKLAKVSKQGDLGALSSHLHNKDEKEKLDGEVKILKDENQYKQLIIEKLTAQLEANKTDVNYRATNVDHIAVGEMQSNARNMALAAQQTIQTLQGLIDDKSRQVEEREKEIDSLKEKATNMIKEQRRLEIENEKLKSDALINEGGRVTTEHLNSMRVLQKVSSLNQKELEKMVIGYEQKIRILTEEMAACERSNNQLTRQVRAIRGEKLRLENRENKLEGDSRLKAMRKDCQLLKGMIKKKDEQLKRLNQLISEYKKELLDKCETVDKEVITDHHGGVTSSETEARLAITKSKLKTFSTKLKEANQSIQELKRLEIEKREKLSKANDEIESLQNQLVLARRDQEKAKRSLNQETQPETRDVRDRRDKKEKQKIPKRRSLTKKQQEIEKREIDQWRERFEELKKENERLKEGTKRPIYMNEQGELVSSGSSTFSDLKDILSSIRQFWDDHKQIDLYGAFKRGDTKLLGVCPLDRLIQELEFVGIRFKNRDKTKFINWIPKDKLNNVDYTQLFYMVKGMEAREVECYPGELQAGSFGTSVMASKTGDKLSKKGQLIQTQKSRMKEREDNLYRKQLIEREKELDLLKKQLKGSKDRVRKLEKDLQANNNQIDFKAVPHLSSQYRMKTTDEELRLDQVKQLEIQLNELQRKKDYEILKLTKETKLLEEQNRALKKTLSVSEAENKKHRDFYAKMNGNMTKKQTAEEKEKYKDVLVASLMTKLETTRERENFLNDKVVNLEKINMELTYQREGDLINIESLNRRIRELEDVQKSRY